MFARVTEARLASVAAGELTAAEVLATLTRHDLNHVMSDRFQDVSDEDIVAAGSPRRFGAVSAPLVFDRNVAEELDRQNVPYVYTVDNGRTDDFAAIRRCAGFLTSNPSETAFAPVQAVSENKPTVIGVRGEYASDEHADGDLVVKTADGRKITFADQPRRLLRVQQPGGGVCELLEGEVISLDATRGVVYLGAAASEQTTLGRFYALLTEELRTATPDATGVVTGHRGSGVWSADLHDLAAEPVVRGFEMLKRVASERSGLAVFATAHTPDGVALARAYCAKVGCDGEILTVEPAPRPLGLVRDERMWNSHEELDLLRLVYLGEAVLGADRYAQVRAEYLRGHAARFADLFAAAGGALSVVRTLCMPGNRLFSRDLDVERFATEHGVAPLAMRHAIETWDEAETYNGCRGMRLFVCRPDIAELWLSAVLRGASDALEAGHDVRLRLLLATITFPDEARFFLDLLDRVAPECLGDRVGEVLDGVSIMLETSAAYLQLEKFLTQRGEVAAIDGVMVGSNDFTGACLNFHREDATRTVIPGFLERGLLAHSPFQHLETEIVGDAIVTALRRSRGAEGQLWGLGGELAGDWQSVAWLAEHAQPLGLRYVTTAPHTMLPSLFAAAQVARGQWEGKAA